MTINIIDKRVVSRDRTVENRQRFLKRIRATIKEQLPKIIGERSLKDYTASGGNIRVNRKTITEPTIHHGPGGNVDRVLPGNDEFVEGDLVPKPQGGARGGGSGTGGGESEDDFIVELSRDEFLNFFFEDLELPNLVKADLRKIKEYHRENAGFQPEGAPNRLSIERSYRQALGRKIVIKSSLDKQIEELKENDSVEAAARIEELERRKEKIPMFEEMDLRYHLSIKRPIPDTHATMIMIMDNSGSMGLKEKTIARKFFWLLYSFLERQYDEIDMIFISHTETAIEMSEDEFFNTRISGGTIVSSALDLTAEIIEDRLSATNIYVAQVSDGDNADDDNGTCAEILEDDILPFVQYFAYVQVNDYHNDTFSPTPSMLMNRGLWRSYHHVAEHNKTLSIAKVSDESEIYQVFRELFKKPSKGKQ